MKTLICIPAMDMLHTEFFKSFVGMRRTENTQVLVSQSSLIYDARNNMARQAVKGGFDRVLWLDSDMSFDPDLMERLAARLDEGRDFVSALYFTRKAPVRPVVYKQCGYFENEDGAVSPVAVWFDEYPRDTIFEVEAVGFGAVMMTTECIKKVAEKFGLPFAPMLGFGEDLSFCGRAQQCGIKMWVDSSIKCGHVGMGTITEKTFIEQGGFKDDNSGSGQTGIKAEESSL